MTPKQLISKKLRNGSANCSRISGIIRVPKQILQKPNRTDIQKSVPVVKQMPQVPSEVDRFQGTDFEVIMDNEKAHNR